MSLASILDPNTGKILDVFINNQFGPTGPPGPPGQQGAQGVPGNPGTPGAQGLIGPKGATGAPGIPGAVGAQGAQGATGAQGIQGIVGPIGPKGETGATGAQGAIGPASPAGTDTVIAVNYPPPFAPPSVVAVTGSATFFPGLDYSVTAGEFLSINAVVSITSTINNNTGVMFIYGVFDNDTTGFIPLIQIEESINPTNGLNTVGFIVKVPVGATLFKLVTGGFVNGPGSTGDITGTVLTLLYTKLNLN